METIGANANDKFAPEWMTRNKPNAPTINEAIMKDEGKKLSKFSITTCFMVNNEGFLI